MNSVALRCSILGICSLLVFEGGIHSARSQDAGVNPVTELRDQFKELQSDVWGDLEKLKQMYSQQLSKQKQSAQAAGNLDLVLEIDAETERLSKSNELERAPSKLPELARLQQIYDTESEKLRSAAEQKLQPLFKVYASRLEELEKELTVSGKIDLALEARREKESVLATIEKASAASQVPEPTPTISSSSKPLSPVKTILTDKEAITGNHTLEPGLHRIRNRAVIGIRGGGKDVKGHLISNAGTAISNGKVYIHNGTFQANETLFYKVGISQELQGRWTIKSCLLDSCQFKKEGGWGAGPYSGRFVFENCVFDGDFFTNWWSVGLNVSNSTFHDIEFLPFSYMKDAGTEAISDGRIIRNCLFIDCTIPASTALATKDCLFRNCKFTDEMGKDPVVNTPIESVLYIDGSEVPKPLELPLKASLVFKPKSEAGDLKFGSTVPYSHSAGKLSFQ